MSLYLAEQFGVIPVATRALLLAQVKILWKNSKILSGDIWVKSFPAIK